MAINRRPRLLQLPFASETFPTGTVANGPGELAVSWDEIVWAALTIGRPSVHHVWQHGAASLNEAEFRLSLVHMALEQHGPGATRLRRTSAFKGLDPTEKGAISYFLGMNFCKLFSSRLLQTPWLLHLDVFRSTIPTSVLGRSRPDLFGQQSRTGAWLAFETKGRASKPSVADRIKAKRQATRLVSVAGSACTLHVGAFTFFVNDALNFHWIDPPTEAGRLIDVPEIGEAWRHYYEPVRTLWRARGDAELDPQSDRVTVAVAEFDLKLHIHKVLIPLLLRETWAAAQRAAFDAEETLRADGFQADGLKIECGPSWRERRSNDRELGY
jgi:hypothetical protein